MAREIQGFVYVLTSPNSGYTKIGGTEKPLPERLRAINGTPPYADYGPWHVSDFRHVTDWPLVESQLHQHFRGARVGEDVARELFDVSPFEARKQLGLIKPSLRVGHETTTRIFKDRNLFLYLSKMFELSGLFGNLDIQGAWTLKLDTKTDGGTWFMLNIGNHGVAWTMRKPFQHALVVDRLIRDYPSTIRWIERHKGVVQDSTFRGAQREVVIFFEADFANAENIFRLAGLRRALVAYWSDELADLRERTAKSLYVRYHSYDAVAELLEHKYATENIFDPVGTGDRSARGHSKPSRSDRTPASSTRGRPGASR